jgi:hypothetical protein
MAAAPDKHKKHIGQRDQRYRDRDLWTEAAGHKAT